MVDDGKGKKINTYPKKRVWEGVIEKKKKKNTRTHKKIPEWNVKKIPILFRNAIAKKSGIVPFRDHIRNIEFWLTTRKSQHEPIQHARHFYIQLSSFRARDGGRGLKRLVFCSLFNIQILIFKKSLKNENGDWNFFQRINVRIFRHGEICMCRSRYKFLFPPHSLTYYLFFQKSALLRLLFILRPNSNRLVVQASFFWSLGIFGAGSSSRENLDSGIKLWMWRAASANPISNINI